MPDRAPERTRTLRALKALLLAASVALLILGWARGKEHRRGRGTKARDVVPISNLVSRDVSNDREGLREAPGRVNSPHTIVPALPAPTWSGDSKALPDLLASVEARAIEAGAPSISDLILWANDLTLDPRLRRGLLMLAGRLDAEALAAVCEAGGLAADLEEAAIPALLLRPAGGDALSREKRLEFWRKVYSDSLLDYVGEEFTCLVEHTPDMLGSGGITVDWDPHIECASMSLFERALRLLARHPSQGAGILLVMSGRTPSNPPVDPTVIRALYAASAGAPTLKAWALKACGEDPSEGSLRLLQRAFFEDPDPECQATAAHSLGRLAWDHAPVRPLVLGLLDAAPTDPRVLSAVVAAAAGTGEPGAFARIEDLARWRPEQTGLLVQAVLGRHPHHPEGIECWARTAATLVGRLTGRSGEEARWQLALRAQSFAANLDSWLREGRAIDAARWAAAVRVVIGEARPLAGGGRAAEHLSCAVETLRRLGLDQR